MYDYTKLNDDELQILSTYILPHDYLATDLFDEMCDDLKPLKIQKLKGTIGALKGKYYNDYFLSSPYWKIITRHYRKQGICPICKKAKTLIIYSPAFNHLGINHLHSEDYLLACGECHYKMNQFIREYRFWKPLKVEEDYQISKFIGVLKLHKVW